MAQLRGVDALQNEIEKSRDKLKGYNENIKKLTGRDPSRPGVRRMLSGDGQQDNGYPNRMARGRGRLFGLARRSIMEDTGPPSKRRIVGGAFSRLGPAPPMRRQEREESPYEEELPHKLSVQSSVVATSRETKNRDEIMQEQTKDKEGMQRNRRMFGLLLGTLTKFRTESKTLETKDVRRKKIEEKLEEKAEKERKKFKQETKLLMEEMHLEQSKISRLEQKMEMVQEHADRELEVIKLKNFIATKAKPRIFWKPVQMSSGTESRMKDSRKFVDELLQDGKDRLDKEIAELMERENKREERIKMRLREDGLLEDENKEDSRDNNAADDIYNKERVGEERDDLETMRREEVSGRLSPQVNANEEEEEEEEEKTDEDSKKKPRRTVVIETEELDEPSSEVEEGEVSTRDVDSNDVTEEPEKEDAMEDEEEEEPSHVVKESENDPEVVSNRNEDVEENEDKDKNEKEDSDHEPQESVSNTNSSETTKRAVVEKEKRRSVEKRDRSRTKEEKKSRGRDGSEDRSKERRRDSARDKKRARSRSRERERNRSGERERRRNRYNDDRKHSRRDSRERHRSDSRDENRDHRKDKSRQTRKDSDSEDSDRPIIVKKEREERSRPGKVRRKSSRSDDSDDDVVVKKETDASKKHGQGRGEGTNREESEGRDGK